MPGIGIVLNPRSRRNLRDPARPEGSPSPTRRPWSRPARRGRATSSTRIAEDFKELSIDVLGIGGGDGTNHVTSPGFLNVYGARALPQLAFLRGGTMNTVANSVGVRRGKPEGLLGRLIRAYARRALEPLANVERRVMRIRTLGHGCGGGSQAELHYGFTFGTGVVYGFLAEYYAGGDPSPLVAAKTLARGIGSTLVQGEMIKRMARPFRGSVTLDGGGAWPERDYLAVAAGTIDHIGLNFRPFYRYAERDEALPRARYSPRRSNS